ncbi:MAG: hypothetical protein V1770_05350 [bacterium]
MKKVNFIQAGIKKFENFAVDDRKVNKFILFVFILMSLGLAFIFYETPKPKPIIFSSTEVK